MYKLDQLYAEKEKKFAEICALLARELGLGDFAKLGVEDRHQVDLEADQHLKEWDETPNSERAPTSGLLRRYDVS